MVKKKIKNNNLNIQDIITESRFTSLLDLSRWIAAFIVFINYLYNLLLSNATKWV